MRKTVQLILQLGSIVALGWACYTGQPWYAYVVFSATYIVGMAIGTTVTYTQDETEDQEL